MLGCRSLVRPPCRTVFLTFYIYIYLYIYIYIYSFFHGLLEQDRQCTYNVTLKRSRANIVAVEKQ